MGWNSGYEVYEKTVVAIYNLGGLTPELLRAIIEPYRNTDIDHGGKKGLIAVDGLEADEIVLKLLAPDFWVEYEAKDRDHPDFVPTWMQIMGSY